MTTIARGYAALLACGMAAAGCRDRQESPFAGLELAGCAELLAGPRCVIDRGGAVTVWVPGDVSVSPPGRRVAGGVQVRLAVADGQALALEVGRRRWRLPLVPRDQAPAVARAGALLQAGRGEEALAILATAAGLSERQQVAALVVRARVAQSRGESEAAWR